MTPMSNWTINSFMLRLTERLGTHEERIGQGAFNVLNELDPDLADSIRGTDLDPFYNDDRVAKFYAHVFGRESDGQG